ncbi:MAG: CPBP family intramembrane metalloprotease [Muriicola sp.]|nr:CPBP family intramembrane metalloprotease [Muriicola sp.]
MQNPTYQSYSDGPWWYKRKLFFGLLKWNLGIGISIAFFTYFLTDALGIDMGEHATDKLFQEYELFTIFCLMAIVAPIIEELVFRGPLVFFKSSRFFPLAFYISFLAFGAIHIGNFENLENLWLAPLLVGPQLIMGVFLGFIRVKIRLSWAILLHGCHNGIIFLIISSTQSF